MKETVQLNNISILLKELLEVLMRYGHSNSHLHSNQIIHILSIIDDKEYDLNNKVEDIHYLINRLYMPKAGLDEFYVRPDLTSDSKNINKRLSKIKEELYILIDMVESFLGGK